MSLSGFIHRAFAYLWVLAWMLPGRDTMAATIIAGPDESGFRAAIATAQDEDTVLLTNNFQLRSSVTINKRITITVDPVQAWRTWIEGGFNGALLNLSTNGIVLDGLRLYGSPQTDALRAEGVTVTIRDGMIAGCRRPVASDIQGADLCLERVTVSVNQEGISAQSLQATNCIFSDNMGWSGVGAWSVELDDCVIENTHGIGLGLINGSVKNCVFRYNTGIGLYFDPDNGYLCLSSSLFYANGGGGIYLREGAYATIDNCTFTRHTGPPAIVVDEVHDILFRHCTVSDNVAIGGTASFLILYGDRTRLENCLVADNPNGEDPDASGLVGGFVDGGGNVIGGPANLSPLRDNGGPTLSLQPLPGSPAIDAGQPSDVVADARGLSRLAGDAPDAGAIETDAGPVADTDADGIPDIWEDLHGLNPDNPADALSDSDGDGQNARAEFGSGTDPANGQSAHRTEELIVGSMSIYQTYPKWGYLTWTRHPGVFYYVEASNDLHTWRRLPDTAQPGGSTIWHSLGLIEANFPNTFYRVVAKK